MSEGTERRLAAIVSADVVGYSRLMGADETGTLATMKAHRRELWSPIIQEYGGRIVGGAGDSILVEFASAVAAMESSIAVQQGMEQRNADLPEDKRMLLRIGINIGEVIVDGDDIFGDGVNIAARMQEISAPGGIAISRNVQEQVRDKLDIALVDDGAHEVKNIAQPIHVWRWLAEGSDAAPTAAAPSADLKLPDKPSIAVRPSPISANRRSSRLESLAIVRRCSNHCLTWPDRRLNVPWVRGFRPPPRTEPSAERDAVRPAISR